MKWSFHTIEASAQFQLRERASKFLAFAFPVNSEEEIKDILKDLDKKYHDASHVCYAWRLGTSQDQYRANDAGEPSGTAGKPILGQIDHHALTNVLVAVVRYFGGTKLGTGGLIQAYREAARGVLEGSTIIERPITTLISFNCKYERYPDVMKWISAHPCELLDTKNDTEFSATLRLPIQYLEEWEEWSQRNEIRLTS